MSVIEGQNEGSWRENIGGPAFSVVDILLERDDVVSLFQCLDMTVHYLRRRVVVTKNRYFIPLYEYSEQVRDTGKS